MQDHSTSAPWKVGVLFSRTGITAVSEEAQLRGTLVAIEEINSKGGINGRPIQPVVYDPGSDAKRYGQLAKKLMVEDEVTTIFGCYTSDCRKAVLPVVERLNGLLWYPTPYEGFEFSPNVICTGATLNQNSMHLCQYMMRHYGKRFYFVGNDYIYPRESNRVFGELVVANGGMVVGERYFSLFPARSEFPQLMRQIKQAQPDVIFSTMVGESADWFYQAYHDAGLNPKTVPIASLTTTEPELRSMGLDVGEGHIAAASYFQGLESAGNTEFLQRYHSRYGDDAPTNMCLEASYFQVNLFAKTLEQTNSTDTHLMRASVMGSEINAPQGYVTINPLYGHADLWSRIGRANRSGQFDILSESAGSVTADPYLIGYGRALARP